jgi:hypothetical protein
MKRELLRKPFRTDQLKQREGHRGKILTYVDVAAVIERLNEACDLWSFEVVKHEVQDGEAIVLGKLTADGVVKMAFGGSNITVDRVGSVVSIADDLKSAASDALKKSASMLGVGLEIYGGARVDADSSALPARPALAPAERITTRQIAAVSATCKRLGIPRGELLARVAKRTGKGELAQLSRVEASQLITELGSNGNAQEH